MLLHKHRHDALNPTVRDSAALTGVLEWGVSVELHSCRRFCKSGGLGVGFPPHPTRRFGIPYHSLEAFVRNSAFVELAGGSANYSVDPSKALRIQGLMPHLS